VPGLVPFELPLGSDVVPDTIPRMTPTQLAKVLAAYFRDEEEKSPQSGKHVHAYTTPQTLLHLWGVLEETDLLVPGTHMLCWGTGTARDLISIIAYCTFCLRRSIHCSAMEFAPALYKFAIDRVADAVRIGLIPKYSIAIIFHDASKEVHFEPATHMYNWEGQVRKYRKEDKKTLVFVAGLRSRTMVTMCSAAMNELYYKKICEDFGPSVEGWRLRGKMKSSHEGGMGGTIFVWVRVSSSSLPSISLSSLSEVVGSASPAMVSLMVRARNGDGVKYDDLFVATELQQTIRATRGGSKCLSCINRGAGSGGPSGGGGGAAARKKRKMQEKKQKQKQLNKKKKKDAEKQKQKQKQQNDDDDDDDDDLLFGLPLVPLRLFLSS
jgi:hypothetical protein